MLRSTIASLTRTSFRSALQPSTSAAANAIVPRLSANLRNYSEQAATAESTPGSEGAEAASSAQPDQKVDSVQPGKEEGKAGEKAKDAGKAAPASDASAKQIEQLQKETKDLKVCTIIQACWNHAELSCMNVGPSSTQCGGFRELAKDYR